jgi:hypothetical protein
MPVHNIAEISSPVRERPASPRISSPEARSEAGIAMRPRVVEVRLGTTHGSDL